MKKKFNILTTLLFLMMTSMLSGQDTTSRGKYFSKKIYDGGEIPVFSTSKALLPQPVLTEDSELVDMYWKCWEIAFKHFMKPQPNSPFVSNILDEAFCPNIFQWDMIFMTMFARYGNSVFPAIHSLDNFYCRQHDDGYICREIQESDGKDYIYEGRKNTVNPPLFSWAEVESFKNTGDKSRFEMVLPVLEKYVEWLNKDGSPETASGPEWYKNGRRAAGSVHQLYWNTGLGSGMDNTPRGGNGWVDMSCQMVLQYNNLAQMAKELGLKEKETFFKQQAKDIGDRINKYCWNETDGLYYDVDNNGKQVKCKTSGCFWPMIAGIASPEQCAKLVTNLKDTASFWRQFIFPTLGADQKDYDPKGGYWLGAVWAPTNYAIIKGLEQNGYEDFATEASIKYLDQMYCVYKNTGTVWENYMPDSCAPGAPARKDFVGWTGDGPIALLIENVLGFRVNGVDNSLTWILKRTDKHGIKNLKVGKTNVSAVCEKRKDLNAPAVITVESDKDFTLIIKSGTKEKKYDIKAGKQTIKFE